VEGDGWQGNHVVYKGGGHVSQGRDGVVSVSLVPGFVWNGTPIEVEEEIRLGGNLSPCHQGGTVG